MAYVLLDSEGLASSCCKGYVVLYSEGLSSGSVVAFLGSEGLACLGCEGPACLGSEARVVLDSEGEGTGEGCGLEAVREKDFHWSGSKRAELG
eukprot:1334172-Amorphochlora_amoeboformis.AAC.1